MKKVGFDGVVPRYKNNGSNVVSFDALSAKSGNTFLKFSELRWYHGSIRPEPYGSGRCYFSRPAKT